ncbi:3-keto-disaccharide hydrolase [Croceivirga thetidis]|uniref:DUF1080 domain-containing protein n=1 Tax=Croceivirga thetidis TaxID=2721623 RepID=A0ABX1GP98_9FLAO|nr:DUF1080 domain-containing protein [Croceivirga thetidis]NKI31738.1 DUF1080 domain-containing protein [Croceivirga thetidis]
MKRALKYILPSLLVLFLNSACNTTTILFQENSDDWEIFGAADWRFSNGNLIGAIEEGAGFVMTKDSYKDFALELEFYPDSTINSGVFIRCMKKELSASNCHELNIWDLHPNQDYRTGAIVSKGIPKAHVETLNKWNSYKILAMENRIQVWVNTIKTADSTFLHPPEGYIALQAMGNGKIKFRNIMLKSGEH